MALDDAITLLLRVSEEEDVSNESLRTLAKRVVETLGCLALAIVHAGALIKQKLYNMEDYCKAYSRNRQQLFGHQNIHAQINYKYTVYTTWEISIEMIRKLASNNPTSSACWSSETVENALDLLNLFSVLHMDNIPVEILERDWKQWKMESSDGTLSDWTKSHQPCVLCKNNAGNWDPLPIREAISLLSSFSLIRINDSDNRISLHPLVHAWIRDRLTQSERADCWITAVSTLSASLWDLEHPSDYQYGRSLVPHISSCFEFVDYGLFAEGTGTIERLWMAHRFAVVYLTNGIHKIAYRLSTTALELFKRIFAAEDEMCLQIEQTLGRVYCGLGEYSKAVDHQERVLQIRSKVMEEEHPAMLVSKIWLASFYNMIGRDSEALEMQKCILHTREKVLGDKHMDTLEAMGSLAYSYLNLSEYQAATKLAEKELHMRKKLFNHEDPATLASMGNLALLYSKVGRYEESLRLNKQVLQLSKKNLGDEHPYTLSLMNNLAVSYSDVGRAQEALKLHEETLQLRKKILGDEHPDTLLSMNNLALSYMKVDRIKLYEEILQLRKKILGDEHPDTLSSMNSTATCYDNVGRNGEAIELLIEVVDTSRRTLGEKHPSTILYTSNLNIVKNTSSWITEGSETSRTSKEVIGPVESHGRRGIRGWLKRHYRSEVGS